MGTKNQPGKFDCYQAAELDEPMFVLLGRDPAASLTVYAWRAFYSALYPDKREKLAEAKQCIEAMVAWCVAKGHAVPVWVQVRMLKNVCRFVAGCISGIEDDVLGDDQHLASYAVDGLADAQGYLETLARVLEERSTK
jgi:hypothetical protein